MPAPASGLQHFGWSASPYSAKTRTYLRFKGTPFEDRVPSMVGLGWTIRRAVGRMIMPTVLTPEGEWLQDSSAIIDALESRVPGPTITPPGPTQRLAALLLELHADEWLPMASLHFRWNRPVNAAFALDEFARCGVPWLPRPLGRRAMRPMADKMRSYLPRLGVGPGTEAGVERFAAALIATLETHLSASDFLLGGRPCIGDFALFGHLWSHLFRDPDTTALFDEAPSVRAWFERLLRPPAATGPFLDADDVPATLDPVFRTLFAEQMVWIGRLVEAIDAWCADNPDARRVPRSLGDSPFSVGGAAGQRRRVTFVQWKAQRPLEVYGRIPEVERGPTHAWLDRVGGRERMAMTIRNPLIRVDFKPVLANRRAG